MWEKCDNYIYGIFLYDTFLYGIFLYDISYFKNIYFPSTKLLILKLKSSLTNVTLK